MKLIVGLGNPGLLYAGSRHNIGCTVVKALASSLKISFQRDKLVSSLISKSRIGQQNLVLACPQTFMNLSGIAVRALLKKFEVTPENLLVVCDDLDLELGRIKIRAAGSSGGQNGLKSIIENLDTENFSRLRIGIGRPHNSSNASKHVLSGFLRKEKIILQEIKETAVNCCMSWVEKGTTETMNAFNIRSRDEQV